MGNLFEYVFIFVGVPLANPSQIWPKYGQSDITIWRMLGGIVSFFQVGSLFELSPMERWCDGRFWSPEKRRQFGVVGDDDRG